MKYKTILKHLAYRLCWLFGAFLLLPGLLLTQPSYAQSHPHHDDPVKQAEHLALLALLPPESATHTAVGDGVWSNPAVWSGGAIPGVAARVYIPAGRTVTYDRASNVNVGVIRVDGTLAFATDRNTQLVIDTLIGAPDSLITIGTAATPLPANRTAHILFADNGPLNRTWDPTLLSRGFVAHDTVQIYGADKLDFTSLVGDAPAGSNELRLELPTGMSTPLGWRIGDQLVLGGTYFDANGSNSDNSRYHDEVLTITAIDGNRIHFTNNQITSGDNTVLRFNHTRPAGFEGYNLKLYVANVTRNVSFTTQNAATVPTQQRGHVMLMHSSAIEIHNAGFYQLGRSDKNLMVDDVGANVDGTPGNGTNPRGRYLLHFHRNGANDPNSQPARATGNALVGGPGWGIVQHDSHVILEDNVVFDVVGSGIVAEAGNEIGAWRRNLTIKTTGDSRPQVDFDLSPRMTKFDMGFNGEGYWVQGAAQVEMIDNIAVSAAGGGINIFSGVDGLDAVRDADYITKTVLPAAQQYIVTDPSNTIDVTNVMLRKFSGFQAYNAEFGIIFWNHMRNDDGKLGFICPCDSNIHDERSLVENFKLWHMHGDGIFMQYSTQIDYVNGLVVGNPQSPIPFRAGINGEGRGVGIGTNGPAQNILVKNVRVEGFTRGLRLPREGGSDEEDAVRPVAYLGSQVENSVFANNIYHLSKKETGFGNARAFPGYFRIVNTTFGPQAANLPPVAAFTFRALGDQGVVQFNATSSYDTDAPNALELFGNAIASYAWDFDGNGSHDAYGVQANHKFNGADPHPVTLTVWDAQGATHSTTQAVTVTPAYFPPLITNGRFAAGAPLAGSAYAFDSSRAGQGWIGLNMAIDGNQGNGGAVTKVHDQWGLAGLGQIWLDNRAQRGSQRLRLDAKNSEASGRTNHVRLTLWGVNGEFNGDISVSPRQAGATPMQSTLLLDQQLGGVTYDWRTFTWDVNLGDGYQFIVFKIYLQNVNTNGGDVVVFDNLLLGHPTRPAAADDTIRTNGASAVTIPVLANDDDLEGEPLTVAAFTPPTNGAVTANPDGTLRYTPFTGYSGPDEFTYTVSDGVDHATARVTLAVDPISSAGLVAEWTLDEGKAHMAYDSGPEGADNSASLYSGATWSNDSVRGKAVAFNGNNSYLYLGSTPEMSGQPYNQRTITLWVKFDQTTGRRAIFEIGDQANGLSLYLDNNRLFIGGESSTNGWESWQSVPVPPVGLWQHLALVLDGPNNRLTAYLNGQTIGQSAGGRVEGTWARGAIGRVLNGFAWAGSGWPGYEEQLTLLGKVDEVRVYTRPLSAAEVSILAQSTVIITPTPTALPTATTTNTPLPTATSTNTPRPTATATLTRPPTATPSATPIPPTPTNAPPPSITPTPTFTPGGPPLNQMSPLGSNLSGIADWSSEWVFIDAFKAARAWIPQRSGVWDTGEAALLDLDAQGWVRALPRPEDAPQFEFVGTLLLRELNGHYPAGQYTVLYDGEGTINYGFDARKNVALSQPGRDVLDVTPSNGGIYLTINATDPNRTGNYIRNIRVIMPGFTATDAAQQLFHPTFVEKLQRYKTLRFMDWMRTNGSTQGVWSNRSLPADARYSSDKGVPLEIMVTLANRVQADPWFTMPHQATDEYITQFATLVRDTLGPERKVYVEYSNEVWNTIFSQGAWIEQQAQTLWPGGAESGYTKRINWLGKRTAEICDLWENVWGAQSGRVTCVLGAQSANSWTATQALSCPLWANAPCQNHHIDAIAIAPYFGYYLGSPATAATVQSWTGDADGGLGKLFTELTSGGLLSGGPTGGALQAAYDQMSAYATVAATRNLALLAYEGGQHIVGYGGVENNTLLTGLFINANRDPRMGTLYSHYLTEWKNRGGQLFMHFVNVGQPSKWGSWGALEYMDQGTSPKYAALQSFIQRTPCWWNGCSGSTTAATLTIRVDAQPDSIQNFRFTGGLGAFHVDDAAPDDNDGVNNSRTVTKNPGGYTINQTVPSGWVLATIACIPAEKAQVDLDNRRVTVTAAAGDNITCTFVNQRTAKVTARKFQDNNGDKRRQVTEPWLTGWTITAYNSSAAVAARGVTNSTGQVVFNALRPGSYTICETLQSGWNHTLPATLSPPFNQPCYSVTLQPNQTAATTFGNRPVAAVASETAPDESIDPSFDESGVMIINGSDVGFDESGYDGHDPDAMAVNQPVQEQRVFLPIIQQ